MALSMRLATISRSTAVDHRGGSFKGEVDVFLQWG
jgi:hypothetical protein